MYQRLMRMCEILMADTPLANIRQGMLQRCVLELAKRPRCRPAPYCPTAPARRIAVATAAGRIAAVKSFFLWVSRDDELGWIPPPAFNSIFRIDRRKMRTPEEQAARVSLASSGVKLLKLAQLARLYEVANERQRTFILLGLNCGFTSGEISSLGTYEVEALETELVIHRCRPKTGVEAQWALWPETAAHLLAQRAPANPKQLWFLTRRGNTLVEVLPTSRRDSIQRGWKELWSRFEIPGYLSFRHLRKTGADAIKRLGSLEESEMYLAHQEPGLNKVYANRNWPRMWECVRKFRQELPFLNEHHGVKSVKVHESTAAPP
jgi:integrase